MITNASHLNSITAIKINVSCFAAFCFYFFTFYVVPTSIQTMKYSCYLGERRVLRTKSEMWRTKQLNTENWFLFPMFQTVNNFNYIYIQLTTRTLYPLEQRTKSRMATVGIILFPIEKCNSCESKCVAIDIELQVFEKGSQVLVDDQKCKINTLFTCDIEVDIFFQLEH